MIQAIRGMNDLGPGDTVPWQYVEQCFRDLMRAYGYQEIRMPLMEKTELFKRSIGEVTDIVEKEMYTFEDRNGESLTLRPEGTAGCVRAVLQHGLIHNQVQRLWYGGPMFRHERKKKGRYRQFHQKGIEVFGLQGPDIDAEIILMTARFWRMLGIDKKVTLELNSLGDIASRNSHRNELIGYFSKHESDLDEDSKRRLHSNPLRILDSKNPDMQEMIEAAPRLMDHLDAESMAHFQGLCTQLENAGVSFTVNPRLVRGLDYYTRTVFEWVTTELGAQGTICAGGRYDGLVEQLGGKATPAVGFALGLERLVELVGETAVPLADYQPHAYLLIAGEEAEKRGIRLAEHLRDALPGLRLVTHCGGGSFKSQMKKADKSGASLALILGESEVQNQQVGIKYLREERDQQTLDQDKLVLFLNDVLERS